MWGHSSLPPLLFLVSGPELPRSICWTGSESGPIQTLFWVFLLRACTWSSGSHLAKPLISPLWCWVWCLCWFVLWFPRVLDSASSPLFPRSGPWIISFPCFWPTFWPSCWPDFGHVFSPCPCSGPSFPRFWALYICFIYFCFVYLFIL